MLGECSVDESVQLASKRVGAIHVVDMQVIDTSGPDLFLCAEILHFEEYGVRVDLLCKIVLGFLHLALDVGFEGIDGQRSFPFGLLNLTLIPDLLLVCHLNLDLTFLCLLPLLETAGQIFH